MPQTTYTANVTPIAAATMQDLDGLFYTAMGGVAGSGTITKVQFPAAQSASADANALDDYEEGSWTPALGASVTPGTQTYSTQLGRYTKIGNLVYCAGVIALSAKDGTTSGNLRITGLPFTVANVLDVALCVGQYSSLNLDVAGGYYSVGGAAQSNNTFAILVELGDNVGATNLTEADFGNSSSLVFTVSYRV